MNVTKFSGILLIVTGGGKVIGIKSEEDLVVVPVSYFKGMEKMLESIVGMVEINNFEIMDKFLCLRKWMNPDNVDKETRKMFPNLRWDNIHLLLPQEANYPDSDSRETERI